MKRIIPVLITCIILLSGCREEKESKLTIAVAANMQFAIKELAKTFTDQTNIQCDLIISSSGKLTAQIKEKAPYDVFVSADMKYPTELFNKGFTTDKPEIYGYGKLVMWSVKDNIKPSISLLTAPEIKHIALANPKMAPYGTATLEVLNHYGIYESVKDKLVYGENISQTNQFIISKAAEIGFTSKSVVLSPEMKEKGHWQDIDETTYSPIDQGVVVIKQDNLQQDNARKFYNFLFSNDAKTILEDFGYSIKIN